MQKMIRLGIADPCSQSWAGMTPDHQGRFCAACQKTVVDFTAMNDHELLRWFATHQGSVCGRLTQDQLDRPLTALAENKGHRRYWHYLIAGLLFSSEASAQGRSASPPMSQYLPALSETAGAKPVGIVVDQLPMEGRVPMATAQQELSGITGGVFVGQTIKKRKPLADTIAMVKDTLATIGLTKPALTAYPNPVARGASITLSARLDAAGKYSIQLLSSSGAVVETQEVDRTANPGSPASPGNITLPIAASLVPGIYFVKLSHPALAKCYTQEIVVF